MVYEDVPPPEATHSRAYITGRNLTLRWYKLDEDGDWWIYNVIWMQCAPPSQAHRITRGSAVTGRIRQYQTIVKPNSVDLDRAVTQAIQAGWQPYGPVQLGANPGTSLYSQTMVTYDEEDECPTQLSSPIRSRGQNSPAIT